VKDLEEVLLVEEMEVRVQEEVDLEAVEDLEEEVL
jgi:hypothetical protein